MERRILWIQSHPKAASRKVLENVSLFHPKSRFGWCRNLSSGMLNLFTAHLIPKQFINRCKVSKYISLFKLYEWIIIRFLSLSGKISYRFFLTLSFHSLTGVKAQIWKQNSKFLWSVHEESRQWLPAQTDARKSFSQFGPALLEKVRFKHVYKTVSSLYHVHFEGLF